LSQDSFAYRQTDPAAVKAWRIPMVKIRPTD
jgi:hypothetical protein